MSRSYRIRVRETLRRVIRAEDHVSSQLEVLEILPADQMADLLAEELERRGFERDGKVATRRDGNVVITVELDSGVVTVKAEGTEQIKLNGETSGLVYDEQSGNRTEIEERLRDEVLRNLEQDAQREESVLQKQITDQLEAQLSDLKSELDQAVNRATAEALKQKAAQIGQIKQVTDDIEAGSLTIVVEV